MLILNSSRFESVFSERSFATYLAGSQYITWESLYEERTRIVGYARAVTLSYGLYCFMYRYSSGFFGLPHSSNSMTVRGRDSSNIVLITSTKGTYVMTMWNRSGRRFVTAPINSPPALPPMIARRSFEAEPSETRYSAEEMKSVKVFI